MKLIFTDNDPDKLQVVRQFFPETSVSTCAGDMRHVLQSVGPRVTVLSPANSYGDMGGGVDLAYRDVFGYQLQVRLQTRIADRPSGQLEVGKALRIRTMGFGPALPVWMIAAPTMPYPMNIRGTINVREAFTVSLKLAMASGDETLLVPVA